MAFGPESDQAARPAIKVYNKLSAPIKPGMSHLGVIRLFRAQSVRPSIRPCYVRSNLIAARPPDQVQKQQVRAPIRPVQILDRDAKGESVRDDNDDVSSSIAMRILLLTFFVSIYVWFKRAAFRMPPVHGRDKIRAVSNWRHPKYVVCNNTSKGREHQ